MPESMDTVRVPRAEAQALLDNLNERIRHAVESDAASVPIFTGIAALHDALTAPTPPAVSGVREAAIRTALCLSGFVGEGLCVEGFTDPADAYCDLTAALGMPDADDDDLRAALASLAPDGSAGK